MMMLVVINIGLPLDMSSGGQKQRCECSLCPCLLRASRRQGALPQTGGLSPPQEVHYDATNEASKGHGAHGRAGIIQAAETSSF